jgi:hypothetical protein
MEKGNNELRFGLHHSEGRPAAWRRLFRPIPDPFSHPTTHPEKIKYPRNYEDFKYEKRKCRCINHFHDTNRNLVVENYTKGIPRFTALHNSNDTFAIYRGFGPYAARILMHRELELNELVGELDELDREDATQTERNYRLQSIEHKEGWDTAQKDLLKQLEDRLSEYCETSTLSTSSR